MNWHAARDDDFVCPIVRGMKRGKGNGRQRILSDAEIEQVWHAAQGLFGRYVRFLLLTAVRKSEASEAQWSEVDQGVWTVPAEGMKQKLDHAVPLSEAAIALMEPNASLFVFTATGERGVTDFTKYKDKLDEASGVTGWVLHDLRRSARSLMGRANVPEKIAERCLAHVPGGIVGRYDKWEYLPQKREALASLARLVGEIVA